MGLTSAYSADWDDDHFEIGLFFIIQLPSHRRTIACISPAGMRCSRSSKPWYRYRFCTRTSNMRYSEIQDAALCREDSWFLEKEGACTFLGSLHVHGTRIQTTGNRRRCVAFSYRTFSASHWQLHTPFTERHLQII